MYTPGALEVVRRLERAFSCLASGGDEERPPTAESTLERSDVSADMMCCGGGSSDEAWSRSLFVSPELEVSLDGSVSRMKLCSR